MEKALEKHGLTSPPKYSIPRAQSATAISLTARITKNFPGVGKYPDADKVNSMAETIKKSSRRVIHPYKSLRYMDIVIKQAKSGPGPGAYHIGPKQKKKIN